MKADFSGWATKAGLLCTDGRTIMPGAFEHQDTVQVPLVWQHGHKDIENVLGHVILEHRDEGVYAHGFLNDSNKAKAARAALEHKDITMLSIWANELIERVVQGTKRVMHGSIKEVSLVLSGANPGAKIENISIRHSDDDIEVIDDEAVITTGIEIELLHSDDDKDEKVSETLEVEETEKEIIEHAEDDDEKTIQDVVDSMDEDQKKVLYHLVGEAMASVEEASAEHDNINDDPKGNNEMRTNVFDKDSDKDTPENYVLTHSDVLEIVADATKNGSMATAVTEFKLAHGIEDIEILFPDAHSVDAVPEWIKRRTEWVAGFLGATRKSPFSRIRSFAADITHEEARAKGYIKGTLKKEEFFRVMKRTTTPVTIYKKQKLDRDDILDITDFDVVAWLKAEMRIMLDEEIARAALIGDGRDVSDDDKINEGNIRPIASDHELYTTQVYVNLNDASSSIQEFIDAFIKNRAKYRGTGLPTFFTTETYIAQFMLLKDQVGRRIYKSLEELATELRVAAIIPVEALEDEPEIVGIAVNPADYVMGASAGGQVSMFDDFDIDYNQQKYLIETRLCGALTKIKSALCFRKTASNAVLTVPAAPTFDAEEGEVTIVNTTGVVYKNAAGVVINALGSPYSVAPGETYEVFATPASSAYYFATSDDDMWAFTNENEA